MIFKKIYQAIIILSIIFFVSCIGIEREWEELESNYDHVLNVFGILNLDRGFPSFIGLYRTTDLNEVSQQFSSVDTLFYCDCTNQGDNEDEEELLEAAEAAAANGLHTSDTLAKSQARICAKYRKHWKCYLVANIFESGPMPTP